MYFEKNYTARNYSQNNFPFFQKFQEVNKTVLAQKTDDENWPSYRFETSKKMQLFNNIAY